MREGHKRQLRYCQEGHKCVEQVEQEFQEFLVTIVARTTTGFTGNTTETMSESLLLSVSKESCAYVPGNPI